MKALLFVPIFIGSAHAQSGATGDPSRGAQAFRACAACHSVAPGEHTVTVTFVPAEQGSGGKTLAFEERILFAPGRVVLITHDNGRLTAR